MNEEKEDSLAVDNEALVEKIEDAHEFCHHLLLAVKNKIRHVRDNSNLKLAFDIIFLCIITYYVSLLHVGDILFIIIISSFCYYWSLSFTSHIFFSLVLFLTFF